MGLCVCEGWHKGFSEAASEPFLVSQKKAGSGTWLLSSLEISWGAVPGGTGWARDGHLVSLSMECLSLSMPEGKLIFGQWF